MNVLKSPATRWILPLWVVVAAFVIVMVEESGRIGIPIRDPGLSMTLKRPLTTLAVLVVVMVCEAVWRGRRRWFAALRERWTLPRLGIALSALVAYNVIYLCYHNLKSWVVFHSPQDSMLERWDKAIFFGHDPAVLLHDLLGFGISADVLDVVYQGFTGLTMLALILAVVLPEDARRSLIFISGASWLWVLGTLSYYLIPSLGPFASLPQEFRAVPLPSVHIAQAHLLESRALLLKDPSNPAAFAAIAAFASLHVAYTSYVMLMARYFKLKWASIFMYVWVFLTVLATIYLGYHFFVDLIAGFLIALASVYIGRWMTDDYTAREPRPEPTPEEVAA